MNATLHFPALGFGRSASRQIAHVLSAFVAILLTLRGLLGPEEEPDDDPAAIYYTLHNYALGEG